MKRPAARTTGMLAVSILIAVFALAPVAFAADKVWVCKVVGPAGGYFLQPATPIFVAKDSTDFEAAFADSQPSFVLQPGDYSGAEPNFGDCEAKWAPRPAISVVKTATVDGANTNGKADAGELIAYSFLVTNSGNVTLTSVAVVDPRLVSAVTCAATTLARGASTTCTPAAAYLVTAVDVVAGLPIVNTATATGTAPDHSTVSDTDSVDTPTQQPGGDTTVTTTTTDTPSISLVKLATLGDTNHNHASDAGETISYSFVVTNTGNVALSDVAVADLMPGVSAVTCPSTTLAVGATVTCTAAAYTVTDANVAHGRNIVNEATASGLSSTGRVSASDTVSTPTVPSSATEKPVVKPVVQVPPVVLGVAQSAPGAKAPTAKAPAAAIPAATTLACHWRRTSPVESARPARAGPGRRLDGGRQAAGWSAGTRVASTANASGLDRDSFGRARIRLFTTVLGHRLESPSADRLIAIHWYAVHGLARDGGGGAIMELAPWDCRDVCGFAPRPYPVAAGRLWGPVSPRSSSSASMTTFPAGFSPPRRSWRDPIRYDRYDRGERIMALRHRPFAEEIRHPYDPILT